MHIYVRYWLFNLTGPSGFGELSPHLAEEVAEFTKAWKQTAVAFNKQKKPLT
jgi:hypothetical protein